MENIDPLQDVSAARAAAADRLVSPWWYHLTLGLLLAAYVVGLTLGGPLLDLLVLVVFLGAVLLLIQAYRRATGMWVTGLVDGPARRWSYAMGGSVFVVALAATIVPRLTDTVWPMYVLAALLVPVTVVLGRRFDEALRQSIREQA
ncbi:hypothetical protein [Aeromicrobium sp. IC_218]|uniref:hypothetical protein n=1 Tax=Aeromicrobium sp. IC_218 TaxID=2545468 RepID=UPI00103CBD8A|nr:hypothetical protein [Aeromicrobium sp. IC_218]TCI98674.1 hypothetical protein E0W78_09905 [Aeromicrobium sp. IC_218]